MGEEKSRKTPFQKIIPSRNEKERIYKSLLSCFFGKILGQAHSPPRRGVSRAALLASSITVRKSAERKQRTYRPTSLRGECLNRHVVDKPCAADPDGSSDSNGTGDSRERLNFGGINDLQIFDADEGLGLEDRDGGFSNLRCIALA